MNIGRGVAAESGRGHRRHVWSEKAAGAVFFPALVAFIWAGLLFGFLPRIYQHIVQHRPPYLWIVHAHAVAFVAWMLLLTAQTGLVRSRNLALHRRLGQVAFYLGPATIILGLATQFMVSQARFGTTRWDPPFLAVPLADLASFGILLAFAIRLRGNGPAHKRLMLLATAAIANVGFSRWWGGALAQNLGEGYGSEMAQDYLGGFVIIAALIAYDIAVRGRPSRPAVLGGALSLGIEALAIYLYFSPWWFGVTNRLLHP
jgi:uncharacterized membrane protein YozB (DUF420 family)